VVCSLKLKKKWKEESGKRKVESGERSVKRAYGLEKHELRGFFNHRVAQRFSKYWFH